MVLKILTKKLSSRSFNKTIKTYNENGNLNIIAVDCGIKENIIRCLVDRGARVTVVPFDYDYNKMDFDGIFISNGPGDPSMCTETINNLRTALDNNKPIFGICLGNQLLARAAGHDTYKMKFGNRGQNQPVIDLINNRLLLLFKTWP